MRRNGGKGGENWEEKTIKILEFSVDARCGAYAAFVWVIEFSMSRNHWCFAYVCYDAENYTVSDGRFTGEAHIWSESETNDLEIAHKFMQKLRCLYANFGVQNQIVSNAKSEPESDKQIGNGEWNEKNNVKTTHQRIRTKSNAVWLCCLLQISCYECSDKPATVLHT